MLRNLEPRKGNQSCFSLRTSPTCATNECRIPCNWTRLDGIGVRGLGDDGQPGPCRASFSTFLNTAHHASSPPLSPFLVTQYVYRLMERKQAGDTRLACRKEDKEREMDLKTLLLKELVEGQESATQLHTVLQDMLPPNGGSASAAATLMIRILSSFSQAISLLDVQGTVHGLPNARFPDEQRLAASGNKRKLLPQPRKSGYRRRAHPCTNTIVLSKTMDDGHVWRKYGQKNICASKFPRSYFRCGHKYDRGCQATRQVQRSEEDPSTFVITYMGQHACAGGSTPPGPPSPCVISFGSNTCAATAAQERLFPSPISSRDSEVPSNPTPWTSSTELTFADLPLCFDSVSMVTPGCHSSADAFNSEFNPEPLEFGGVFCFGQGELLPQG